MRSRQPTAAGLILFAAAICACAATSALAQSTSEKPRYPKLDSVLNQLVVERTAVQPGADRATVAVRPSLSQLGLIEYGEGRVGVTIRFRGPGHAIRDFLASHNGHVAYTFDGAIEAYIDPAFLPELDALVGVGRVDAITRPEPQVTSQGVQVHNAVPWQAAGYLGQGVKVGIIDIGFMGWSWLPMADTPSVGAVRCYTGGGFYSTNFLSCQTGFSHGTAVAEAFHDMAPNATFYLATYITKGDLQAAVQWMVQQGVRVINISQSLEWDGPGDGTSPYSDSPLKAVDAAVAGGAVVTISTGNHANKAWFGPWQDRNADGRLEFDSSLNDLSCVFADASELVTVELRWQDSWGGATRDLDLELYDWYRGIKVDVSSDVQAGRVGDVPHERLNYLPVFSGRYCVAVKRYAGTAPSWVQLRVASNQPLDIFNSATSITSPAETANPGALAVGAVNWQTLTTIETFSSRGPTPDGRIKPDIVGVDQADSYTYGPNGFSGTSQSAPHVAGLAALLVQGYPSNTPAQIATQLKNWALARGGAVPNNTWGYGLAYLPSVYNLTVSRAGSGAGTVTSVDSRLSCGSACVHTYFSGTAVTLTAIAAAGSVFAGWTGGSCTGTGACAVPMTSATQVTATFAAAVTPAVITPSPLTSGAVAKHYHLALEASGGTPAYSWSVVSGPLPPGLTLTAGGVLAGKPEVAGIYVFRVRVADARSAGSERDFSLTVDLYRRYFAEGASTGFFDCYFALANPNPTTAANVTLHFLRNDSQTFTQTVQVPAMSRRTVNAKDVPGLTPAFGFSTILEADVEVVADRTMTWDSTGYGSHAETSIAAPAQTWYLAEGATQNGFQLYYLIENPNPDPVDVQVSYLRRSPNAPIDIVYRAIAGYSRTTIYVNGEDPRLAWGDVSAVITSLTPDRPIIVERAMYLDNSGVMFNAGHDSAGVTAPATDWFLAEGATVGTFDMYILLANPGDTSGTATITYMLTDGRTLVKSYPVEARSRQTVWVNSERDDANPAFTLSHVSLSAMVHGSVPIIVERSMWWSAVPNGPWIEATNAVGTTETGTMWAVADGEQDGSRSTDTYVLVANASPFPGRVRVTLMGEDGSTPSTERDVPANSRSTFWTGGTTVTADAPFGGMLAGKKFGAVIESLPTDNGTASVVVERAMYSNANGVVWAAGTDVVATKLK